MLITTRIQLLTFKYILYNYVIFIGSMHLTFTFPVVNPLTLSAAKTGLTIW